MTNKQIKKLIIKFAKVVQKTNEEFAKKKADQILDICMTAVDHFYAGYPPKYYDRIGSLHDIYKVSTIHKNNKSFISLMLSSNKMGEHRADNDYIYDISFYYGYHGGATKGEGHPNPKNINDIQKPEKYTDFNKYVIAPYWRTNKRFTSWGRRAKSSSSPYWAIRNHIDNLDSRDILYDLFKKNAKKYLTK